MKTLLLTLALSTSLFSAPDCQQTFRISNRAGDQAIAPLQQFTNIGALGSTSTATLDNRITQCSAWFVSYDSEGFSGVSVTLQDAPAANGVAGTFVTFAGLTQSGTNPMTVTTSSSFSAIGYYPYINILLSGIVGTGSINITVFGWKSPTMLAKASAVLNSYCVGGASSSATLAMPGMGVNSGGQTCTLGYQANTGIVMPAAGIATALYVTAALAGVNSSSGAFTIFLNDSATNMTCTVGTGTSCNDLAHPFTFTAGQRIGAKFTTQGTENLCCVSLSLRTVLN